MKKKGLAILLALGMVLSMAGCGGSDKKKASDSAAEKETEAVKETAGPSQEEAGAELTLDMISCLGETHKIWKAVEYYAAKVEEVSGGRLKINLVGGDEVMAEEEQLSALKSGTFDMMWDLETLSQLCPLYSAMSCTGMTSKEELDAGLYELYREAYEKEGGVYWLGKASQPQWWTLAYNGDDIGSIGDIKGKKLRCNSATSAAVEALGGVPTVIAYGEIYEAMERGIIDGFIMTPEDWVQNSWQDVTDKFCDVRILEGGMTGCLCNLDTWNSLTKEQQGWLRAPFEEYVEELFAICEENQSSGEKEMAEAGVTLVPWTKEEKEKAQELVREAQWNSLKSSITPEYAKKFAEICGLDY
ncbi:MAG: TRAP transporter substrate-binding protein DctP [Lachnospiraceae bacterium]|jgi:TRAP-type C4-dicarboxylate transport system substrate-binding protein|nr:TRAP transporter substrate-binding protein DctP [Lachnospiraceae bacterium]